MSGVNVCSCWCMYICGLCEHMLVACTYVGGVNTCWWYVSMWVVSVHVDGVYVW